MVFPISLKTWTYYGLTLASYSIPAFGLTNSGTAGCGIHHVVDGVSRDLHISTNGVIRDYRLHLPSSYHPNTPAPLVISYHGHGKDMVEQEILSQFSNDAINSYSMIAVYPQGLIGKVSRSFFR